MAVDLEKAIYQSCDVFFYTLAEKLGIDRIAKYATDFGLGQKTGIDLPNEVSGVMPSEEWKIRNFKQKWFAGETISVGIGQGAIAITPVQLLRAISAISMGGKMVVPHVINPTDMPPGFVEAAALRRCEERDHRSRRMEFHYRRDVARAVARGNGAFSTHTRNRHRRQDRIGADRFPSDSREVQEQRSSRAEWLVCGIHASAQSRHCGLRAVPGR